MAIAIVVALTLPIAWRRRAPLAVACLVMTAAVALAAMLPEFNSLASPMFVLVVPPYSVAANEGRQRALAGLGVCLAGALCVNAVRPDGVASVVFSTAMVGASWAIGRALRSRRQLAGELHLTAERIAAEEDGRERLAVADERTRIARELNTAVALSISQMVVQSDAARRLLSIDRVRADTAMAALEDSGREALTEMRRILGVLRRIDDVSRTRAPARGRPDPGAGGERLRRGPPGGTAGGRRPRPVARQRRHQRVPDPPRSADAIANLGPVEIALRFGDDDLVLEVVADGRTAAQWPTPAMCERAALCDATLDVTTSPSSADADACADAADIRRRTGMSITIVIADDQELIRTGFRMILDSEDDLEVVGEAATGREAVALARRLRPDVVLMDIRMPELDGIEATRQVVALGGEPPTRILMLTTFDLDEYVFDALRAGASGFLLKDVRAEQLAAGVRMVSAGDSLLAPSITRRLIEEFAGKPRHRLPPRVGRAHTPRDGGVAVDRDGQVKRRDRRGSGDRRIHGQDTRRARADETRRPRPRAGRRVGLRGRRRDARPAARGRRPVGRACSETAGSQRPRPRRPHSPTVVLTPAAQWSSASASYSSRVSPGDAGPAPLAPGTPRRRHSQQSGVCDRAKEHGMDVRTVTRWFGAASLVVGGIAVTIGTAVEPSGDNDSTGVALAKISRHLSDQRLLIVTDLFALFMLPGILCLMRLARRRAPRLALAGGSLAFAGWLGGLVGLGSLDIVYYYGAKASDRDGVAVLIHAIANDWTSDVLLASFLVGQVLGTVLLAAALWRARVAARWAAVLLGVGSIVQVAVHDSNGVSAAVWACVTVGMGAFAISALRTDNESWDVASVDGSASTRADVSGALAATARTHG